MMVTMNLSIRTFSAATKWDSFLMKRIKYVIQSIHRERDGELIQLIQALIQFFSSPCSQPTSSVHPYIFQKCPGIQNIRMQ